MLNMPVKTETIRNDARRTRLNLKRRSKIIPSTTAQSGMKYIRYLKFLSSANKKAARLTSIIVNTSFRVFFSPSERLIFQFFFHRPLRAYIAIKKSTGNIYLLTILIWNSKFFHNLSAEIDATCAALFE